MKKIAFLLIIQSLALQVFSQPDPELYFASSRLDYYTNEKSGEIMVYVPENKKNLHISVDLVFEYQILNKNYPVVSHGVSTVPFQMELLREGENEITVSFYENEKWVDSRKVWVTIRPDKNYTVKIDRAGGGLVVDDLPSMPVGFFTCFPVDPLMLEEEVTRGFTMVSPYQDSGKKKLKQRKAYMDRCADLGMKVNFNICMENNDGTTGNSSQQSLTVAEKRELLKKEILTFKDHPALLAWFIADEPDGKNIPPDSLMVIYNLIKEMDPYHPVSLLVKSPRNSSQYCDVTDIMMTNPSPVPQGNMREVSEYVKMTLQSCRLEKPVWIVPQTQGGNGMWQREPSPDEIRAMTYIAVVHGATGIQYSIRSGLNSFPKSASTWAECGSLAMEINALLPYLLSHHPAPELIVENPNIHARSWNKGGQVIIVVVNERNEPAEFALKMKDVDITIPADVLFENRKLVITEGNLKDIIEGYGTRIYHFDARNKPDRVRESTPGNLTLDPGFEDILNPGVPSACFAQPGYDRGSTYFIDPRVSFQGEHSLRMNNPADKPGNSLSFFGISPNDKKSYTISVMAKTGASPNRPSGKNDTPVIFSLALGEEIRTFNCKDSWQKYEIKGVRFEKKEDENLRVSPGLEMTGKGTAWFDMLEVYPDMEMNERRGEEGKGSIVELKCVHPDVKIFYTLDGNEPTAASQTYLIPFEIQGSVKIKAAAFVEDRCVGYIEN